MFRSSKEKPGKKKPGKSQGHTNYCPVAWAAWFLEAAEIAVSGMREVAQNPAGERSHLEAQLLA